MVAKWITLFKIDQLPKNRCRLTYLQTLDLGGEVPLWAINAYSKMNLNLAFRTQQYFQRTNRLEDYGVKDGILLGEMFHIKIKKEKQRAAGVSEAKVSLEAAAKRLNCGLLIALPHTSFPLSLFLLPARSELKSSSKRTALLRSLINFTLAYSR